MVILHGLDKDFKEEDVSMVIKKEYLVTMQDKHIPAFCV